jgi:hypothetical protein
MRGFKALYKNKGSSIIMVLLAMAFISILGTILLSMAYTGFEIKAAQAKGERAFYSAETALDEVRAGVQNIVSDCIARAYTLMLQEYRHDNAGLLEEIFREHFRDEFKAYGLISQLNYDFIYNGDVLWSFITDKVRTTGNIAEDDFSGTVRADDDVFVLEDITVRHRSADGFVSVLSSDIVIVIPDFSYVRAAYTISGVPEFALIATDRIELLTSALIQGSAYGGSVSTGIGELTVANGTLISRGDIVVEGGRLNSDYDIWANKIYIGDNNSAVELRGSTFVADDLLLQGAGASATLAGRYYGFGNSLSLASQSSSIIVNAPGSTLNISQLEQLFLAGHSFIDTGGSGDILIGQSVSVKSDQLAYLVPAGAVTSHLMNPIIILPGESIVINENPGANPTILIDGNQVVVNNTAFRHALSQPVQSGHRTLFLFMKFDLREEANDYFRNYFTNNSDEIEDYIKNYLPNIGLLGNLDNVQASGVYYTIGANGEPVLSELPATEYSALTSNSERLKTMFGNITRSLSSSVQTNAANPYEYIVNSEKVNSLSTLAPTYFEGEGNILSAIINCNQPYRLLSSIIEIEDGEINLVISTGNIVVDRDFEGLIISNGYIQLRNNATVTATPNALIPSMGAKNAAGETFSSFLNLSVTDDSFEGTGGASSWDMASLVYYENWHRR